MQFTTNKHDLANSIARILGAIEKKSSSPVLNHIKAKAAKGTGLTLSATDLVIYARTQCPADIDIEGTVCIPAEKLKGAMDNTPGDDPRFELDENFKLNIDSEGCHYDMACLDEDQFPAPFQGECQALLTFPHGKLPDIIKACSHAISNDLAKHNLNGINIIIDADKVTAAATDGHRLSVVSIELPHIANTATFTLPAKACRIVANLGSSIDLAITPTENMARIVGSATELHVLLLEDKFPDYRRVIPSNLTKGITINSDQLITSLEACGVMCDEADKMKSIQLQVKDQVLTLTTLGVTGTATMTVPVMGDDDLSIRFNSKYLLQAVKALACAEIFFKYLDGNTPATIFPADHDKWSERLEVLMPLRS